MLTYLLNNRKKAAEKKIQYCKYFFVVLYKLPMVQQIPIVEVQCQSLVAEKNKKL